MLRVFVSHSARDAEARRLLQLLEDKPFSEKFAVRVDREIKKGEDWRAEINTWIGYCDAAIVLLSKDALQSDWVKYECSILAYRRTLQKNFCLIPVFLQGVRDTDVDQYFGPQAITTFQAFKVENLNDPDQIVKAISAKLDILQESISPVDQQVNEVERLLEDIDIRDIRRAADILNICLGPWEPVDKAREALALKLTSAGILNAHRALVRIRVAWKNDKNKLTAIHDLVASSWIDLQSALQILEAAGVSPVGAPSIQNPSRVLAVEASQNLIAYMYVIRSAGVVGWPAEDRWVVVSPHGHVSEEAEEDICLQVTRELEEVFKPEGNTSLADEVRFSVNTSGRPVFVILNSDILSKQIVERLRREYDAATFLVMLRKDGNWSEFTNKPPLPLPQEPPEYESKFCQNYNQCLRHLRRD
jgi:hypothetical protein